MRTAKRMRNQGGRQQTLLEAFERKKTTEIHRTLKCFQASRVHLHPVPVLNKFSPYHHAFKSWPVPFKLKNLLSLPRSTALLLSQAKSVEKEGRFHLLDAVYTEVSNYTLYPTSRQYDQVVDEIYKRYPQLSDAPNLTPQGVREL
ncbi:uncharacterized protein LOC143225686 isoform X2 [Tachypleus tridentatus]|uniref:uncharacterized protein LOC143225683 isoform X2 n=1 Tax=Tachypleus tridentatus TaxID=6853 RepID=UPI003FD1D71F